LACVEGGSCSVESVGEMGYAWLEDAGARVLDVRGASAFEERRVSNSRNVVLADLKHNLFELPADTAHLIVISNVGEERSLAEEFFSTRNWANVEHFNDEEALWEAAEKCGRLESGPLQGRPPILFDPAPAVVKWVDHMESKLAEQAEEGAPKTVLDLGCGSGREVVFLARRGWNAVGVDEFHHALGRMMKLASSHNVEDSVKPVKCSVHPSGTLRGDDSFAQQKYDLVVVVRFLQKEFLPTIASLVRPGGFIVYETFAVEGAGENAVERTPKTGRLLSVENLQSAFPGSEFEHISSSLRTLPDKRILRCFVAQRRLAAP